VITVVGLGPGDLDRAPGPVLSFLLDPKREVIARTAEHPAARRLAELRPVAFCDDLYETAPSFERVYDAIADRVIAAAARGPVVYATPGSPFVGEFAVRLLLDSGADVEVVAGESFVDAALREVGYDPLDRGLQILNGHDLPDPLVLDKPTIIAHLDRAEILADVCAAVGRVVADGERVTVLADLGAAGARVIASPVDEVDASLAGQRTSLFIDAEPGGLIGAVKAARALSGRRPRVREGLRTILMEESRRLTAAIERLETGDEPDWAGHAEVEEALGDVLGQVLAHAAAARGAGAFDIDDAAEVLRRKLARSPRGGSGRGSRRGSRPQSPEELGAGGSLVGGADAKGAMRR